MTTALITGASSGLGAEFARQLAAQGHALVLVARDRSRLERFAVELRSRSGVDVEVLPADLTDADELAAVVGRVSDSARPVGILVNNAGIGLLHDFDRNPLEDEVRHLRLHVEATMSLCHAALRSMTERREGRIINVSSVAAFVPRGSYSAAKAWTLAFSRWANMHYKRDGVLVTALCPGFVHTEFHERMGMTTRFIPPFMWLRAERVVREGLLDNLRGKAVSIPSRRYKGIVVLSHIAPARLKQGPRRRPKG
ncbi:SDR family NAD(P)-dependent oxidoreductase [Sinomonas sp. JGH33]|uniref:SDR family NAD(P)-dependent oxidoreductase n=1 Tax=Sinomonas terricola TaxID=3110330 RepID=A0ABU5T5J0_9MICC|nr:SDR family NAD(P)-dependent oxidoreductase [Sinomonas sp. JGH33]MEA5454835.1 SDR family NAD(P)-dependent oxidoreductase [Sinomonas sp. JGH33]